MKSLYRDFYFELKTTFSDMPDYMIDYLKSVGLNPRAVELKERKGEKVEDLDSFSDHLRKRDEFREHHKVYISEYFSMLGFLKL